jgi:ABC-type phosphate transport system substrate-binding protein
MRIVAITLCLLGALSFSSTTAASGVYVAVNAPAGSSIDTVSLQALLTGQQRNWDDGNAAKVILPSRTSSNFDSIAQELVGTSGRVMQRLWFRLVFSGRANAPDYVDSAEEVVSAVQRERGAVGIFIADSAPPEGKGIKIVKLK